MCASPQITLEDCEIRIGTNASPEGTFRVQLLVDRVITAPGKAPVDCAATHTCLVAASDPRDFDGTVVTTPIIFLDSPADIPVVEPGTASIVEGDAGFSVVEVPVSLSRPFPLPVTVTWRTLVAGGLPWEADPGDDYGAASGSVTFASGETTATVPVTVLGDTDTEGDQGIFVAFVSATPPVRNGPLFGLGGVRITDDDAWSPAEWSSSGAMRVLLVGQ
jgi:hypothetical protein